MNAEQNADFKMMMEVQTVCNTFISAWSNVPSFKTPFTRLMNEVLNVLPQALARQRQTTTGVTQDKASARTALEDLLLPIAGGMEAYAASVANQSLRKQAHIAPSSLRDLSDVAVVGEAERIATMATANIANLGPFNVTAAKVTALRTAASTFTTWIGKPQEVVGIKKQGTDQIETLRKAGRGFLDVMDAQMVLFQANVPDFYAQYFSARAINDPARRKRAVVFSVRDAKGQPVPDAVVFMEYMAQKKRTGPSGTCFVASFAPGTYNGTVEKNGYITKTFVAAINAGETTKVDVVLAKK